MKRLILPKVDHWLELRRDHCLRLGQAAGDAGITSESARFEKVFRKMLQLEPRTVEDLVLLAEITVYGCEGNMMDLYPDDVAAEAATGHMDVVTHACLTRGVLNLLGGQTDKQRRAREIEFLELQRKERRTP